MTPIKIGLALGSGAGRGWAHIGVVRALAKAGIDPDIVCGTSIGALVGGVYLAGQLDALESWAQGLNKLNILRYLDFRVAGGGLIGGDRLVTLLDETLGALTVEELKVPFAAVAADLRTGHEIWLTKGRLVDALRASFALPGLFRPHRVDGSWLVDGALVNPVPVSVCRAFGATMVIAVNLNADIIGKHRRRKDGALSAQDEDGFLDDDTFAEIGATGAKIRRSLIGQLFRGSDRTPSVFNVMVQSLNIIQDRLSRSRLAGDPPDVSVTPRLGHIGLLEFDRAEEEIAEGEAAIERALPSIREAIDILG
ncbi:MAG: patatin-like phospholipase family protein [Proteobacteria bacterium]|nr:patatin-like phospholipase family protein [Pseudomonadota bacterium]